MGDGLWEIERVELEPLPTPISDQGPFIRAAGPISSEWEEIYPIRYPEGLSASLS